MDRHVLVVLFLVKAVSSAIVFQCDFEANMCGFVQSTWDTYGHEWIRNSGRAPNSPYKCCPTNDHTTGSGYYAIFSARQSSSYSTNAQFYKQITVPAKNNIWCRFYYFMYSNSGYGAMGVLSLSASGQGNIFTKSDNQGNAWKKAEFKLNFSGSKRFTFKATKYRDPYGDIAIDDFWVAEYYKANDTKVSAVSNSVCLNSYIELECNIYNGFPPPDEHVFSKDGVEVVRSNNQPKTLKIQSKVAGKNTFSCLPNNVLGNAPNSNTITITTHNLPTVSAFQSMTIEEGSKLKIMCNGTGNGPFTYTWNEKGKVIKSRNYTIENVNYRAHNFMKLSCTVTDVNGCSRTSNQFRISVVYKPKDVSVFRAPTICQTGVISLLCFAGARPSAKNMTFKIDGKLLGSSSSIVYRKINTYPPGLYNISCTVSNVVGVGPVAFKSMIIKGQPNVTSITGNQTVLVGSRTLIQCKVTGSQPLNIVWTKVDGGKLADNGTTLIFRNVTFKDIGGYQCTVSNGNECEEVASKPSYLDVISVEEAARQCKVNPSKLLSWVCSTTTTPSPIKSTTTNLPKIKTSQRTTTSRRSTALIKQSTTRQPPTKPAKKTAKDVPTTKKKPEYSSNTKLISEGITIVCSENEMTINIIATVYPHLDPTKFHLKDESCVSKVIQKRTLIQLKSPLNDCGTTVIEGPESVTYENTVRAFEIASPTKGISITRKQDLTLPFNCTFSREKTISTLSFEALRKVDATEGSLGNFTFVMDLFTSKDFETSYTSNDYPLQVELNDPVFVQFKVGSDKGDLHVFAERCLATTSVRETSKPNYVFLDKGCAIDPSMVYNYSPSKVQNFTINAFRFIDDHPIVYLHCMLMVCHSTTKNTKCATGCKNNRKKRESIPYKKTTVGSKLYHLASGPLTRKQVRKTNPPDSQPSDSDNLVAIVSTVTSFSFVLLVTSVVLTICLLWSKKTVDLKELEPLQLVEYDGEAAFRFHLKDSKTPLEIVI